MYVGERVGEKVIIFGDGGAVCEGEYKYEGDNTEGVGAIVVGADVPAVGVGAPVVGSTVGVVVGMYVGLPGKGVGAADVGAVVGKSVGM